MRELALHLFQIACLLMVVANVLWFWIKGINRSKGYRFHTMNHLLDFPDFARVIAAAEDPRKRRKYKAILWSLWIFVLAAVGVMIVGAVFVQDCGQ